MSISPPRKETQRPQADEEKLALHLVARGLLTREEVQQFRKGRGEGEAASGAELLQQLVKAGCLTPAQAQRVAKELEESLHQQVPGYQLLEKLGQGSMGTVYKARQLSMDRLVAVKVLHPRLAAGPDYLKRFYREAHLAAKLSSNNVVQAIDVGSAGNLHYFVMEFVEGTTVKAQLIAGKVYAEKEALEIVLQVAQALEHAHRRQLIHRDVKPANIILTTDGAAKLADLGLARMAEDQELDRTEKGHTIGTPHYIAPELVQGKTEPDTRADIYSLGATLYHMVTGRPPFPHTKVEAVLRAHLKEELTPPDHINTALSSGLGEVVEVMMAKDREQRYVSPAEIIYDLECLLRGEPPRLARKGDQLSALAGLASGRCDEDDEEEPERPRRSRKEREPETEPPSSLGLIVLGILLALSVILNVILLATK